MAEIGTWIVGNHLPIPQQKGRNRNYPAPVMPRLKGLRRAIKALEPGQHITLFGPSVEAQQKLRNNIKHIKDTIGWKHTFVTHQQPDGATLWRVK